MPKCIDCDRPGFYLSNVCLEHIKIRAHQLSAQKLADGRESALRFVEEKGILIKSIPKSVLRKLRKAGRRMQ